ncbi:A24 family peptidase [Methylobacterium platani]|uniref:Peptidase n=2 Tax=Methylobacterium platani TaxID=427683 RepID=A0A179S0Q2_9HYPH|nr:prepilin peptidase [Methylobacterium platani]KMO15961.1 peptidase [Methylobacterium platani JCM 14648]OAS14247.1 peptidase [Methylobacterium platani]
MASLCLLAVFPFLMAYAAASDLLTMTIPNRVSAALVAGFVVVALVSGLGWAELADHAGAFGATLAVGFGLFCTGKIGGGDAKLAAATALWLGFGSLLDYLTVASLFGGLLTLAVLGLRRHPLPGFAAAWPFALKLHDTREGVPYGLALAASGLVVCPAAPLWRLALSA